MKGLDAEQPKNCLCFSEWTSGRVEPDGHARWGVRRPLSLQKFNICRIQCLSE